MLYPKFIEQKLGFDKIKELISEECVSTLGIDFVEKIKFSDDYQKVLKLIEQTAEFKLILQTDSSFPSQNYYDVSSYLSRAAIEGIYLNEEEFFDIKLSLTTIQQILHFFKTKEDFQFPKLRALSIQAMPSLDSGLKNGWSELIQEIDKIIDERGKVRDLASQELYTIRRKLVSEQNNVRKTLERIFKTVRNSGWIGDDMSLTVRNGRLVIPLLSEHKRKLKGFVHDESATGQMAFVEPAEVLEANNEIRDLELQERRELIKILENLSSKLRIHIPELKKAYFFLGLMDFIRAKARFAIKTEATQPLILDQKILDWHKAFHPLLYLAHKKQKKSIVPLKINLDPSDRILLVSGPNAGGKSVLLKTIGLLQYMLQCGILVPSTPDSKFGIFKNLFIDIGDEQSIENDLSTYSSHLTNMKTFVSHANKHTLFLIDEFGTGTEPSLGGAIAESILEQLVKSNALGVINTHYTNLKVYADNTEGLINGAMKFDAERLEPLYELEMGKPGSSFALEVAQKIGLPEFIIKNAKKKLSSQQVDFEKLLKELEIEKKVFAEQNLETADLNKKLNNKLEQYTGLKDFLEIEKKRIVNDAKEKAKNLLKDTNKLIENTIREIKENKADKEKTKQVREAIVSYQELELIAEKPKTQNKPKEAAWEKEEGKIELGSFVRIKDNGAIGQIQAIKGKDVEVSIGDLKTTIKLNRLEKVSKKEFKEATKESPKENMKGYNLNEKMANFNFNLDLRGKRGEEAMVMVDALMNDAIMLGYPEIRIVHGKGDGILRNLIRNQLKAYKQVGKMEDEHADRGGQGVTIVKMK
jgi:DNA mismatch repair protein MutS2